MAHKVNYVGDTRLNNQLYLAGVLNSQLAEASVGLALGCFLILALGFQNYDLLSVRVNGPRNVPFPMLFEAAGPRMPSR